MKPIHFLLPSMFFVIGACGSPRQESPSPAPVRSAPSVENGTPVVVDSNLGVEPDSPEAVGIFYKAAGDPGASYQLTSVEENGAGFLVAVTQRTGRSGVSYAVREIDCERQTFRYVGEGDTLEEALKPAAALGEMTSLVQGSSSDAAVQAACSNRS
mgnify:CR=1 FL=1|jgi:hypothetical protein